jgi:hypothetical protein
MTLVRNVKFLPEQITYCVMVRGLDRLLEGNEIRLELGQPACEHSATKIPGAANSPQVLGDHSNPRAHLTSLTNPCGPQPRWSR